MNEASFTLAALHGLSPVLVWGVFSRLLGLTFLISFLSLYNQVLSIAGESGVLPARLLLNRAREDFPSWKRFVYFPTLLWISPGNKMLRSLNVLGVLAAAYIVVGGPFTWLAFACCYVVYVSFDRAIGFAFPWDCVLFEAGLFGIFLPPTHLLPELTALAAPAPALCWMYRLLVARVLLGFGKFKFIGSTKDDWLYLKGFFINQPMCSPIGYRMYRLPLILMKLAMLMMFIVEIPVPPLMLVPGPLGLAAGALISLLMLGIWSSGNFGYFNLIIIVLCVSTYDMTTPRQLSASMLVDLQGPWFVTWLVLVHSLCALIAFPANSFCAQSWTYWTALRRVRPGFLTWPITFLRILHPFRFVHPYGVFPPKAMPAVRCIPLIEVSWDGQSWTECHHQFSPTAPTSKPHFVAPHHPRGDQVAIYEGFGLGDASMLHGLIGSGNPYGYTKLTGAHVLVQRILEGHAPSYGSVFFERDTFPEGKAAPVAVRMTTHMLTATTTAERKQTGLYWNREYIGPHLPETRIMPSFWDEIFLPPELWHLEDAIWKRRSKLMQIVQRLAAGDAIDRAVIAGAPELEAFVAPFWSEFLPKLRATDRSHWQGLPDLVQELRARHDKATLFAFERLLGRYSFMLADKLDPIFFDAGLLPVFGLRKPALDVKSYLHQGMLIHLILCEGREVFERVLAQPLSANDYAPQLTVSNGLYCTALFRFELFVFEAQKMRLLQTVMEPKRVQFSMGDPKLTAALDQIAMRLFGAVEIVPFMREQFRGPRFEGGQPEHYPSFSLDASGVVVQDSELAAAAAAE